jgi:hypothetical protein
LTGGHEVDEGDEGKVKNLTGKHEIMKTGRRQGKFWMGLI